MNFQLDPELQKLERKLRSLKPKHVAVSTPKVIRKRYWIRWSATVLAFAGSGLAAVCLFSVPKQQEMPSGTVSSGDLHFRLMEGRFIENRIMEDRLIENASTQRQQLRQIIDEMGLQQKTPPTPDYPVVEIVVTNRPYQSYSPSMLTVRKLQILD